MLVEGKGKLGNLKLRMCLDPTIVNKAIVREPYHFKTPEDIAHLLVDTCIMSVCGVIARRAIGTSSLMRCYLSYYFNTELGRFLYTAMPFGVTVAGDVFQHKLDQCFGQIKQVIVIADDNMIVSKKPNHSDHDQVLIALLETARKCNVQLNYEKLQYKKQEVDFSV